MIDYLKPTRGRSENAAMWFVGYAIMFFAWTIGAGIFALVPSIAWGDQLEPWQSFFASFFQFVPILGSVIGAAYLLGRKPITLITSRGSFSTKNLLFGILSWSSILLVASLIGWAADPASLKFTFNLGTFAPALLVLILLLPIQVCAEELFFRGFIPQSLSRGNMPAGFVVLISTLLFAAPHLLNPEAQSEPVWSLIAYSSMGFGWLMAAKWLGGLEVAIGAHLANNFFGLAIVGYENSVVEPSSIWVGPAAEMQFSAIALWVTIGIWLLIVKKLKVSKTN
jgi:membrane protease YdiL (CAAX protease family)